MLSLIPFVNWEEKEPWITSVDIATPESDYTGIVIFDNQNNLTDRIVFDEPLSDYDVWLMKNTFAHKFNCKCTLVLEQEI
jgi:hypothetical protein